jgi:hypothetical protein
MLGLAVIRGGRTLDHRTLETIRTVAVARGRAAERSDGELRISSLHDLPVAQDRPRSEPGPVGVSIAPGYRASSDAEGDAGTAGISVDPR